MAGNPDVPPVTCRGGPDVAAMSGTGATNNGISGAATRTYQGVLDYVDNVPEAVLGTSLASPLVAGMWADLEAAAPAGGLGFANHTFYALGTNPTTYARDFHDVTQSEEGVGDGVYQPATGWDYTSGFGTPDVAHMVTDVDHTLVPSGAAGTPVGPATTDCTGLMRSPAGNAYDPLILTPGLTEDPTTTDQPGMDFTAGTLTTSRDGRTVTATISGPALSSNLPIDTTNAGYYVDWVYDGSTYSIEADDAMGTVTYTDSVVAPDGTETYNPTPHATGSFTGGVITITAPTSDVGSPPIGAVLSQPVAVDYGEGDTGEGLVVTAGDQGATPTALQQAGQNVVVGCPAAAGSAAVAGPLTTAKTTPTKTRPVASMRPKVVRQVRRTRVAHPVQPTRSLAYTGLGTDVTTLGGLLLLAALALLRNRRRTCTP